MNNPFRIHVTAIGNGYLAESSSNAPIALGASSAREAVEFVRSIASDQMRRANASASPATLMVRIDERAPWRS